MAIFALFATNGIAQNAASWGNVYVADNGQMHVFTTDFNFMTQVAPAAGTKTSRTATTYGKISFADAVMVNATNIATETDQHYIDGYFRKYGTTAIVMPIGQSNIYAPAKVVPTDATGVDGAYYRANPTTIGATLDASVGMLDTVEYWHILPAATTADATISLSWSATSTSGVSALASGSLLSVRIAGYDGTKWVIIPSAIDATKVTGNPAAATTFASGSVTSTGVVDLTVYKYFTLAGAATCQPLIASSGTTKTWNGTAWSPSAPTLADPVTLTGNYTGNLSCNSLAMGTFNVTLANGELLEIVNGVTGTGKVIMASEASLVQRNAASAAPAIELTKTSRPMHWRDYMYYGTPIAGNFLPQLITNTWNDALPVNGGSFDINDPMGYGGPWEYIVGGGGWNAILTTKTGKGFIARIRGNMPWNGGNNTAAPTAAATPLATGVVNFKFVGTANNGNITVNNVVASATQYELLANPYPSAVDAQKFLLANTNLEGSLYFWSANTPRVGTGTVQTYANTGDYAIWTLAGATNASATNAGSTLKPDGKIASGQGFRVKANSGTTAVFNNCMRLTSGNNTFFRAANATIDRYSLNIQDTNNSDSYNQMLVAYMPEATTGFDRMYDAERNSASPVQLYTMLADGTKLGINAKPSFVDTDVVPLGVSNTSADQTFKITIGDREGVFAGNGIIVYLHDTVTNVYHDMATPYTFTTNNQSVINNRFEIVYQANALGNSDFYANEVLVNIKNNILTATTFEVGMVEVQIFDIAGRKVQSFDVNNLKSLSQPFNHAEGIYIAKVKLNNGSVATQKLVNKK